MKISYRCGTIARRRRGWTEWSEWINRRRAIGNTCGSKRNGTIGERLTDFWKENGIAVPEYKFPYKMILVFLKPNEEEGQDEAKDEALIFAYTVHEFGAGEETTPKSKWTVLG
ncbi:hypothetical protein B9Z55_013194 [Caenorhabditis nigoni]|uniref:Uncharacterized protein n=1 Tax=Caenorhabditis nigoni TaxID=1611254 RepID=A0A2G5U0S5_9PELO|nr:hypothetical protein B9Z55_013194 [Caenorhabditis nigoni]